jgi:rfaE bifunctional protein kinase chain/domain
VTSARFNQIIAAYGKLRLAVLGDFCLDRYLEIDPAKSETSIETGLEVFNVVNVRSQPGAAGTILNNLAALRAGALFPIGFYGNDGEGFELFAVMNDLIGVNLQYFLRSNQRRTFTYCKPLVVVPDAPPRELSRLDSKNWSPTPDIVSDSLIAAFEAAAASVNGVIIMDQVDLPDTGVVTSKVLNAVNHVAKAKPDCFMLGDSRRGLKGWPPVCLKMNERELASLTGASTSNVENVKAAAVALARSHSRPVFVTMAERGIVGAEPGELVEHVPALPVRGEIDIVGAGDAVTANLTVALAAGATLRESLEIAMAAASVVIHQLGTTGTANVQEIRALLFPK